MARPKRTDAHLRVAHSITEQLMIRQFTSRQRRILDLILRLSWGCNKEYAIIPHLADFQIIGLDKSDIAPELQRLEVQHVITSDRARGRFAFVKDFDHWQVSTSLPTYRREGRLAALIKLNLSKPAILSAGVGELPTSDVGSLPTPAAEKVGGLPTEKLVDHPPSGGQSTNPSDRNIEAAKESSKEKEIKDTTTGIGGNDSKNFGRFCELYEQNIAMLSPIAREQLLELSTDYSLHWFEEAVKEAVSYNKRAIKYVAAILERWGREGFKAPIGRRTGMPPGRPPNPQLPDGKELQTAWGKPAQEATL